LSGDRAGGVGGCVVTALGLTTAGAPVAAVALDRHQGTGRPDPAGYRTARRVVGLAARLGLPLLTVVDTPGADPSDRSERGGIAGEIARTFAAVSGHPHPTASLVVGEGGSGGALAFASTDRLLMLEGSIFSVIGPEGAAAILHRDAGKAAEVAPLLRLTAADLADLGIVDGVVSADDAVAAVEEALAHARPGDGRRRFDEATARWLR
jgi:acetyl-CoA carboxylase carboxyl transferase subunit beta